MKLRRTTSARPVQDRTGNPVHHCLTEPGPGHRDPEVPVIPGMVDLSRVRENGLARCFACGWEGIPTTIGAVYSLSCPRCQRVDELWFGKPDEVGIDLSSVEPTIWYGKPTRRLGRARMPGEKVRPFGIKTSETPIGGKPGRNAPCDCGSGKKRKKCCYA